MYDAFLADPRIEYAAEPIDVDSLWRGHTQLATFSPKVWNDAYLAAFAEAASLELVTFDQGFGQYHNLRCTILT